MSVTEMTESLQFRSQALAFASSSSGNKPFNVKEEVAFNFKKTFQKPNEKITADKNNNMCTRCGGKPHSSRPCPALSNKCNTCEKVGHFSKMCRSRPQPNSGKYKKQNNFCEEENVSSEHASPASEMGMFYTKEQIFSMSVTWEYIAVNNCKVKMQVDTGADSTVIESKIWTEFGKPQLDGKIRHLESFDGHQLTLLGSLTCDVEWNGSRLTQKQLAVVQSDKEFWLHGRDLLPKHGVNNIKAEHLPAVKGYKAHVKLIPGTQPMFCKARKILLLLQDNVTEKLEQMVRQGILEPVQLRGVTDASPVVWQRKKSGELRLCVDLKVHINGKVMDEDYPIPDMETIFHNHMGPHTLAKLTSQMPTIKLNLTKKLMIYAQSTHLRDCSRCADYLRDWKTLLQSSRIASNQHSKELKVLWSFKTMYWCMELPRSSLTRECLQSRVDYVRKNLT